MPYDRMYSRTLTQNQMSPGNIPIKAPEQLQVIPHAKYMIEAKVTFTVGGSYTRGFKNKLLTITEAAGTPVRIPLRIETMNGSFPKRTVDTVIDCKTGVLFYAKNATATTSNNYLSADQWRSIGVLSEEEDFFSFLTDGACIFFLRAYYQ